MESDESIDFVDSEVVNAYGSVVAKEEHENPCEYFGRYGKYSYHDPTQKENSYIGSATGLSFTEQPPKSM